jgi:hypothetical protein
MKRFVDRHMMLFVRLFAKRRRKRFEIRFFDDSPLFAPRRRVAKPRSPARFEAFFGLRRHIFSLS